MTFKFRYFQASRDAANLKQQYRTLAQQYHPDRTGRSHEPMIAINKEYELLKRNAAATAAASSHPQRRRPQTAVSPRRQQLQQIAQRIQRPPLPKGVTVWIVGGRVWVKGIADGDVTTTARVCEVGFRWDEPVGAWYFIPDGFPDTHKGGANWGEVLRKNRGVTMVRGG